MSDSENTHETVEKTDKGVRAEKTTTDASGTTTTKTIIQQEGEPQQIKPDGR